MVASQRNVLLVGHGRQHLTVSPHTPLDYKGLAKEDLKNAVYVDIDPECKPDKVMDVTENHMDSFEMQFDHIYIMYLPSWVLKSKQLWYNVAAWLKPGGIVQTVLPLNLHRKHVDYLFGLRVMSYTGLEMLPKAPYMRKRTEPGLVLRRDIRA